MTRSMIFLAMLSVPLLTTSSYAQSALTADQCQPLTAENTAACCSASNWRDLVVPGSQASCGRSDEVNTQQQTDDGAVGSVTTPGEGGVGTTPPDGGDAAADTGGNPGNSEGVGQAGEKGMDGESPSTGTKGNSN